MKFAAEQVLKSFSGRNNFFCASKISNTLNSFLLGSQNIFNMILSSYVEEPIKENSSLNFMSSIDFQASKIWIFL